MAKTILFMTNSEYGQANVVLSVALEVASNPQYDVHLAGFADFRSRFSEVNTNGAITYHTIESPSMSDLMKRNGLSGAQMSHAPGILSTSKSFDILQAIIIGWKPDEYIQSYGQCLKIIQDVKPHALVLEIGMWQAHDAARSMGLNYVIVAPSSAKELVSSIMAGKPQFTKFPFAGSGSRYPLTSLGRLKNYALIIGFIVSVIRTGYISAIKKARQSHGIAHTFPMNAMYRPEDTIICPYLPQLDYDYPAPMPSNFVGCGPIVMPAQASLFETDRELSSWLGTRKTVLINLGTHLSSDPRSALEISKGIAEILAARTDLQILWKLKYDWTSDADMNSALKPLVEDGRLRATPWLKADPALILMSGHIICHVHHGGANAYFETCRAAIPHLILPCWWDTYEYADRARYLGIGLIGNEGVAPGAEAAQFTKKLLQVLGNDAMNTRAKELGKVCGQRGEGRLIAAETIWRWADDGKSKSRKAGKEIE